MGDLGPRIGRPKLVQDRLVRDLARQPRVLGRDRLRQRTHERPAPVGRRPRDGGDAARPGAGQEVPRGLLGVRQHQRPAPEERAQGDLQAAVPAYVVERAPDGSAPRRRAYRARERRQRVRNQLRQPGRPRGQQHPLGPTGAPQPRTRRAVRRDARAALSAATQAQRTGPGRFLIGHERVHLRDRRRVREVRGGQARRTEHETARDPVELDHRQQRLKLTPRRDEHRAPPQVSQRATEARPVGQVAEVG